MNDFFRALIKRGIRSLGYDLVPFPLSDSWCLSRHLSDIFEKHEINCVLDVGAHYGEYGAQIRDLGYSGRIVSFEPIAANYNTLIKRVNRDAQWHAHHLALGNSESDLSINVMHDSKFSSFLHSNQFGVDMFGRRAELDRTETTKVRRLTDMLDDCVNEIQRPRVFLKTDTQGYDLEVIEGVRDRISDISAIQMEVPVQNIYDEAVGYLDMLHRLNDLGYELTGLFPVSRDHELRVIELDCVFIKK